MYIKNIIVIVIFLFSLFAVSNIYGRIIMSLKEQDRGRIMVVMAEVGRRMEVMEGILLMGYPEERLMGR